MDYVVFIMGFDLFCGCVIEMSPKHRAFSAYDPMEYKSMVVAKKLNGTEWLWLDNVPHVQAKVNGKEVMLMLDFRAARTSSMFQIKNVTIQSDG